MQVQFLGQEDLLEEGTAIHSSILAWRIPGQRSLARYCPQSCNKLDTTEATQHACMHTEKLKYIFSNQLLLSKYVPYLYVEQKSEKISLYLYFKNQA